jgi:6-phosphofructokinase 2
MPRRIAYSGTISRVRSGKRRGLPRGVPADYCQRVADICDNLGASMVLDTSGSGLQHIISGVFLLNVRELANVGGTSSVNQTS